MDLIELAKAIEQRTGHYSGGPVRDFERVGRDALVTLLRHGLLPSSRVLDFGCGSLRIGYWLIRFLDPDRYFGIEPIERGVVAGLELAIGEDLCAFKNPQFRFSWDSDMTQFGVPFDFVIARSILTHTCPGLLAKILLSFAESSPDGILLASYWRVDGDVVFDTSNIDPKYESAIGDDLEEDDMRFIGYVKYSFDYMQDAARRAGLVVEEYREFEPINSQIWLKFTPGVVTASLCPGASGGAATDDHQRDPITRA